MIRQLTSFTLRVIAIVNVALIVVMLFTGFADRIDPVSRPILAVAGITFPIFLLINTAFLVFWIIFRWRWALIPLTGFLTSFMPIRTYMPYNLRHDVPEGAIKIMSYNVQAFNGKNWGDESAAERIMKYIEDCDADIVCLQEDMGYCRNKIKAQLDSLYPYTKNIMYHTPMGGNGQGVYSRFPILSVEKIDYESAGNASYAYFLDIRGDTVLLVNNHFESNHFSYEDKRRYKEMLKGGLQGDIEGDTVKNESKFIVRKLADAGVKRAPQADSVHIYIEKHRKYPIITCGDFNDNPISYTHRTVAKGLIDCYVSSGRGVGLSYNQKGFFVRIDNIMCSDNFIAYNCTVDNRIDASDHYPIFCWLEKAY